MKRSVEYTVYLLRCKDDSLYAGIARDLPKRLKEHEQGKGSKYVRSRLPFKLVYKEFAPSRSAAQKREAEIKSRTRKEKEALLTSPQKK